MTRYQIKHQTSNIKNQTSEVESHPSRIGDHESWIPGGLRMRSMGCGLENRAKQTQFARGGQRGRGRHMADCAKQSQTRAGWRTWGSGWCAGWLGDEAESAKQSQFAWDAPETGGGGDCMGDCAKQSQLRAGGLRSRGTGAGVEQSQSARDQINRSRVDERGYGGLRVVRNKANLPRARDRLCETKPICGAEAICGSSR